MGLIDVIKADFEANKGNFYGKFIVFHFRIAQYFSTHENRFFRLIGYPIYKFYRIFFPIFMSVEIPDLAIIGKGFCLWHGMGLVINQQVIIGDNVLLRHNTTIGNKYEGSPCPIIGNNVNIGAHCVIIGEVTIGDNVIIGAGTIVTKSLPCNSIAYGIPMLIKPRSLS
ncbi:serine acetyltransferase [Sphingobacterium multivorum]|uniref:Serine acetyltransferase n=1 Tax=Sphingobacterium multivorum TaxID=28454 RepID=A0A2X2LGN5_SPHMU|nr:serine acetyltransferase [Sphingobacterium multivorum]QRQ61204.1 serine acetyltransferase [Sphingobacterium multivorum]SPZ88470.1 Serine acetyltransferase [Sphingobacterium multivorum]